MRSFILCFLVLAGFCAVLCCSPEVKKPPVKVTTGHFPSFDPLYPPPPGYTDTFSLSQAYPDTFNVSDTYPWQSIDFTTSYKDYISTVFKYCLEGNLDVDFRVQDNKVRKWYHAPWLHYGTNGREYHHGLTRERDVPAKELAPTQDVDVENWAVGFYNAPGGYVIGKTWLTKADPTTEYASFPEGTVSFKLLFTACPVAKLPFLQGSKEWPANIFNCNPDSRSLDSAQRAVCISSRSDSTVRLLQIDIAVKDRRAPNGWVFGTFVYDGNNPGKTVWERMVPVGLMWGDDETVDTLIHKEGAFINPFLKQTVLNADLIPDELSKGKTAFLSHQGLGGRLNGPVDNPISSCISCHSKAAVQASGSPAPMANFSLTRKTFTLDAFKTYFADVPSGNGILTINGQNYNKVDYSLQLAAGIRNYYQSKIDSTKRAAPGLKKMSAESLKDLPEVTRDGLKKTN